MTTHKHYRLVDDQGRVLHEADELAPLEEIQDENRRLGHSQYLHIIESQRPGPTEDGLDHGHGVVDS